MSRLSDPNSHSHPEDILRFAVQQDDMALCILTDVTGGTLRHKGAMLAVTPDSHRGYISNGCVDGDILFQAREALEQGVPRFIRYGEGSPFKDIALPCGGALELAILPRPDRSILLQSLTQLEERQSFTLSLTEVGNLSLSADNAMFTTDYQPRLRLRLAGRGEAVSQLARQAQMAGFVVVIQTPEPELFTEFDQASIMPLLDPLDAPDAADDAWTAVALLFHDHDWEVELLKQAVQGPAFYIGAMGSQTTHERRVERLSRAGVTQAQAARIHGPIGLIPAMRTSIIWLCPYWRRLSPLHKSNHGYKPFMPWLDN